MLVSKIEQRYIKIPPPSRIHQGDILANLNFYIATDQFHDNTELRYAVVMSQDCDLDQDHKLRQKANETEVDTAVYEQNFDKKLPSVLLCPAYISGAFAKGEHITDWKMPPHNPKALKSLQGNDQYKRFHFLEKDDVLKVPELIIDFKHFYTIPTDLIYASFLASGYVATVNELFREALSQRFANYLSRFGLPELTPPVEVADQ